MLKLNLIAEEAKKELKMEKLTRSLSNVAIVLILALLACSGAAVYAQKMLDIDIKHISDSIQTINDNSENYNIKIRSFNELIDRTKEIQADYIPWNCFLETLIVKKYGIRMQSLMIDKNNSKLSIKGFASTRDSLLAYKTELEKSPYLSEINLPFNSLLNKNDINFEITAKLDIKKISLKMP